MTLIEKIRGTISNKKYILLLDGGGTKFRWCLYDAEANQIIQLKKDQGNAEQVVTPGGNLNSLGKKEDLLKILDKALSTVYLAENNLSLQMLLQQDDVAMLVAMAGMASPANQDILRNFLTEINKNLVLSIHSDVDIYLASMDVPHIVVIAGTGSAVKGVAGDGEVLRKGGFGQVLSGDPGSAYAIGNKAFIGYLELMSGNAVYDEETRQYISLDDPLIGILRERLSQLYSDIPEADWVARLSEDSLLRRRLADLASDVFKAGFTDGSRLALQIIAQAAKQLAEYIACTAFSIHIKQPEHASILVSLVGGLFSSASYTERFIGLIKKFLATFSLPVTLDILNKEGENFTLLVVKKTYKQEEMMRVSPG